VIAAGASRTSPAGTSVAAGVISRAVCRAGTRNSPTVSCSTHAAIPSPARKPAYAITSHSASCRLGWAGWVIAGSAVNPVGSGSRR
jgi:hypothetical protein